MSDWWQNELLAFVALIIGGFIVFVLAAILLFLIGWGHI
jgi:hypothetical protein